jgi:RHS repeat-associated protein
MSPSPQLISESSKPSISLPSISSAIYFNLHTTHDDNHQVQRKSMTKSRLFGFLFAVLISAICASEVFAQTLVFGPKTYARVNGARNVFTDSFSLAPFQGTFTLIVENGNANGNGRVMNGSITLNGIEVVTQKDFHQGPRIEKTVTPLANNSLTVQLKGGPPNSFITVSIVRQIEDHDGPVITIEQPQAGQTFNSSPITVSGKVTDISGVAELKVNGTIVPVVSDTFTTQVALTPGSNTIAVQAKDSQNNTSQVSIEVFLGVAKILSVNPNSGQSGQSLSVSITGENTHFVQGVTQANFGAGISVGSGPAGSFSAVTVLSPTSATAQLQIGESAAAGPRTVTVKTNQEEASLAGGFAVVVIAPPTISDFTPKSGPIGTLVTVTGTNFSQGGIGPQVTLNKQGGGTIAAPVSSFTATNVIFVIPAGAATGQFVIEVGSQSATSTDALNVVASSNFDLAVVPGTIDVIHGQSGSFALTLNSSNGFTQLSALSVAGLPSGITASFKPQQITAGQGSVLTISVPAGQPLGTRPVTLSAKATVDGIELTSLVVATVNVEPVTTSFLGRTVVADTIETPLAGVTVKFVGKNSNGNPTNCSSQTVSDAAGNFSFTDLPAGCVGEQLIRYDGLTATAPAGRYAGVDLVYNIVANQVTVSPVLVHLPRIDDKETVMVQQNASEDQTFEFKTVPGLSVTVYAGTKFTLVDGTQPNPFPLTAVQVAVDRLPDAKPPAPGMVMVFIVAFQPANATASQPVAVFYPNTINTRPGTNMVLMTLDPTKGSMVPYGTGTVANDGSNVIPDFDPAHPGKRFGLVHFDWHGQMPPPNSSNPNPEGPCGPQQGKPVDLSSGIEVLTTTDVSIGGSRGTIGIERTYRTLTTNIGPFGVGTSHNYGYRLDTNAPQGSAVLNLIMPDGNQYQFVRLANGNLENNTIPSLRGAVITTASDGTAVLKWKNKVSMRFVPGNFLLGSVLQSITDPNGNTISIGRNPSRPAQITEIADAVGRKLSLSYDGADRVTSIIDPIGRKVTYVYNSQGTLESVVNQAGGITRYTYDTQNRLITVTDSRGVTVVQNVYDDNGRVIEQVNPDGGRLKFQYVLINPLAPTSPVRETTVTDPLGNKTVYRFSPQGFLISVTDALGQTRLLEREPGTNLVLAVRGSGNCNVCGFSGTGDLIFSYDSSGNRVKVTDALGDSTTYTYDLASGKLSSTTNSIGDKTLYQYDERGNLTSITDTRGNRSSFVYNSFGQLSESIDQSENKTVFSYDSLGNLISVRDAVGNVTSQRYDGISRLVEIEDSQGKRSSVSYDQLDQIISVIEENKLTRLAYDAIGNLLSFTDARNNRIAFTYDQSGRVLTRIDQLGNTESFRYDLAGNVLEFKDRRGQVTAFTHDTLNRLVTEVYQDGVSVKRFYDSFDQLIRVEDSEAGVFSYDYDATGQLIREAGPFGIVEYTRDRVGRVASRQVRGQPLVDYSYDAAGNLTRAAISTTFAEIAYDTRGLPQTITRSNGVTTKFDYDKLGRTLTVTDALGESLLKTHSYSYDSEGRRSTHTTNSAQTLITQPASAQYDAANRLRSFNERTYTYDANGNRLTETTVNGTTNYEWDSRNRLKKIAKSSGDSVSFVYDFSDNLIQRKSISGGTETVETYLLDELTNIVHQINSTGEQFAVLTGQTIDAHWAVVQTSGSVEFGLTDAINSTAAVTDSEGSIVGNLFYEPFGQTTSSGASFPFQFTGRQQVQAGLYYYRARFYDPMPGRFLSEDPEGFRAGDENLYRYVFNQPGDFTDPEGRIIPAIIGGILIGGAIDLGIQLISNGGKLECVDWGQVAISGGIGGALGGVGGLVAKGGIAARRAGAVERLLQGGTKGPVGKSRQIFKSGGFEQANKEFNRLVGKLPVKNQGNGIRSATLPDGTTVSIRPGSTAGNPTIQINPPSGKPIKVRYD